MIKRIEIFHDFYEHLFDILHCDHCVGVVSSLNASHKHKTYTLRFNIVFYWIAESFTPPSRCSFDHRSHARCRCWNRIEEGSCKFAFRRPTSNRWPAIRSRGTNAALYIVANVHRANDIRRNPCNGRRILPIYSVRRFTATRCNVYELVIVRSFFPPYYNDFSGGKKGNSFSSIRPCIQCLKRDYFVQPHLCVLE